jgi:glycosyltransferase involved in cell wall biosynthesis
MTLRVAYLLDDTGISNRNALALAQADALAARGHEVRIVTPGLPLTWRSSRAEWVYVDEFREYDATRDDVAIPAADIPRVLVVDDAFYRAKSSPEKEPMRVLLSGESQNETDGVHEGYGAAAHARWFHQKFDLIRAAAWAPEKDEPLDAVQEFHVALTADETVRLVHSADVIIAPSHADEPFGLAAARAMAAGVPVVMTSISAHAFDPVRDFAQFAPEDNAVELGEKLIEVLTDPDLRERLRKRGREVAQRWRAENAAPRLEKFLHDRSSRSS